jgi:hypothetical protein
MIRKSESQVAETLTRPSAGLSQRERLIFASRRFAESVSGIPIFHFSLWEKSSRSDG